MVSHTWLRQVCCSLVENFYLVAASDGHAVRKCTVSSSSDPQSIHVGSTELVLNVARFDSRVYDPVKSLALIRTLTVSLVLL